MGLYCRGRDQDDHVDGKEEGAPAVVPEPEDIRDSQAAARGAAGVGGQVHGFQEREVFPPRLLWGREAAPEVPIAEEAQVQGRAGRSPPFLKVSRDHQNNTPPLAKAARYHFRAGEFRQPAGSCWQATLKYRASAITGL